MEPKGDKTGTEQCDLPYLPSLLPDQRGFIVLGGDTPVPGIPGMSDMLLVSESDHYRLTVEPLPHPSKPGRPFLEGGRVRPAAFFGHSFLTGLKTES